MPREQCAGAVLMVRPAAFGYNSETALTNKLQHPGDGPDPQTNQRACVEFTSKAKALRSVLPRIRPRLQSRTPCFRTTG
jgi:hypothetical protein